MWEIVKGVVLESIHFFVVSSPYLLLGFLIAGVFYVYFSRDKVFQHLGGSDWRSVFKAALLGIPLPLCSCGVIPTALTLRRQGASKGATLAFLISTPETGVDSISITYALLDPIMTIFRPLSALVTAVFTGLAANSLPQQLPDATQIQNCHICGLFLDEGHEHSLKEKVVKMFSYAYGEFLGDIARWLVIGFVLAGAIAYLVPEQFFADYLGSGLGSMLVMLLVGIPLYICATSTTPIAAALLLKGVSPGAVLVFMLSGPATNVATITMVFKYLGRGAGVIYLTSIAVMSVIMGYLLNYLYVLWDIVPQANMGKASEILPAPIMYGSAVILFALLIYALYRDYTHQLTCSHDEACACEVSGAAE